VYKAVTGQPMLFMQPAMQQTWW